MVGWFLPFVIISTMDSGKTFFSFSENLIPIDLALLLKSCRCLTIADLHLGYEEALINEGILVPRNHLEMVREKLDRIFRKIHLTERKKLDKFIINGDLRHQFGPLSGQEWKESLSIIDFVKKRTKEIVVIKGNHDPNLRFLEDKVDNLRIAESYQINGFLFLHGDRLPRENLKKSEIIIIGHEHPVVGLKDQVTKRSELYKCFLKGSFKGKTLVVLPSFNLLAKGSDLTQELPLSPFLKKISTDNLEVFPVSDEGKVYSFGKLKRLYSQGTDQKQWRLFKNL